MILISSSRVKLSETVVIVVIEIIQVIIQVIVQSIIIEVLKLIVVMTV